MNNNTPDGVKHSNGSTMVNGFATAKKIIGTPMDLNEASPSGEAATTQGASAVGPSGIPPSDSTNVARER